MPAPARIGQYQVVRSLGGGGMAEIFLAQNAVGREVALKRVRPHLAADTEFVDLFLREAEVSMGLAHGNIAQVFDFGEADGAYFLAMEYVEGGSLAELLHDAEQRGHRLPFPLIAQIVAELCAGLDHAHKAVGPDGELLGIVHRDIKPENVIVSYDGEVKLVDFGIARGRQLRSLTKPGIARGTYRYFAPEQIKQRELDGRSDVYSTGVLLYRLLTGEHAFDGELMEVLEAIVAGRYRSPLEVDPTIPPQLDAIVRWAMAVEPTERPADARALQTELVGWLRKKEPGLTAQTLGRFARWVWSGRIAETGRSDRVQAEFPDEIERWRRTAGSPSRTDTVVPVPPARPGWARPLLIGLVAAAVAGATVLAFFSLGRVLRPPPTGSGVDPSQMTRFGGTDAPSAAGEDLTRTVALAGADGGRAGTGERPGRVEPQVPEERGPPRPKADHEFWFPASVAAQPVGVLPWAVVEVEPGPEVTATLSGEVRLGGDRMSTKGVVWIILSPPPLRAGHLVLKQKQRFPGGSHLGFAVVNPKETDSNEGELKVTLRRPGYLRSERVDGRENAIGMRPLGHHAREDLAGNRPQGSYRVEVEYEGDWGREPAGSLVAVGADGAFLASIPPLLGGAFKKKVSLRQGRAMAGGEWSYLFWGVATPERPAYLLTPEVALHAAVLVAATPEDPSAALLVRFYRVPEGELAESLK